MIDGWLHFFQIFSDSYHWFRSPLTNSGTLSDTDVFLSQILQWFDSRTTSLFVMFFFPHGKLISSRIGQLVLLRFYFGPLRSPSLYGIFPKRLPLAKSILFSPCWACFLRSLHLQTYQRRSWLIPCHHAIIRTAVSFAILPGCVSWASAIANHLSLGGLKGTTPRKMTPLWIVKASFCWSKPFSASERCFQFCLFNHLMTSMKSWFDPNSLAMSNSVTRSDWTK